MADEKPLLDRLEVPDLRSLYLKWQDLPRRMIWRDLAWAVGKANTNNNNNTGANENETGFDTRISDNLKEILSYKSEIMLKTKKAELFLEAIEDCDGSYSDPATYVIVNALCLLEPRMAFTDPIKQKQSDRHTGWTTDTTMYGFHEAAKKGATQLVKIMLNALPDYPKDSKERMEILDNCIDHRSKGSQKTAFRLAAENLKLDVLKLLLDKYTELAKREGITDCIGEVIRRTGPNEAEEDKQMALEAFKLIWLKMEKNDKISSEIWRDAVRTPSEEVIGYLLNEEGGENENWKAESFITYENAKFVIENSDRRIWEKFKMTYRRQLLDDRDKDLLHTAVRFDKADIVESILRDVPEQIEVQTGSNPARFAIQELKLPGESRQNSIRDTLVRAMIRSTSDKFGIRELRAILKDSNIEADQISLHLSNINTEEQSFDEYVQGLTQQKKSMRNIYKFEKSLKYAKFPDLHTQVAKQAQDVIAGLRIGHREVRDIFEWLAERTVIDVVELSVPDRLLSPHADDDVEYCVNKFNVRVLKWRKLDLYLGNFDRKIRNELQELHLYSSGRQAVHDHWLSELGSFPKLRNLFVYVVKDMMTEKRLKQTITTLQCKLDEMNRNSVDCRWTTGREGLKKDSEKKPMVPVEEYLWAADRGFKMYKNLDEIRNNVVGTNLAAFIDKYVSFQIPDTKRTKVAVIDSGVVVVSGKGKPEVPKNEMDDETTNGKAGSQTSRSGNIKNDIDATWPSTSDLADRIAEGKSYVNTGDDEEQMWWHASEPHGTQMARLICSIDPRCRLYVVKVAETRSSGIAGNVVAEAIKWAIEKKVDIISISLVVFTNTKDMMNQIKEARSQGIVVFVTTADTGLATTQTSTDKTGYDEDLFTIAACDKWGHLLPFSQSKGYRFRFVGENVQVGQIPFLKSEESITGSSAATAIAAGTASLILACCRASTRFDTQKSDWKYGIVKYKFTAMGEGGTPPWVPLENLCGKNKDLRSVDFEATIKSEFHSNYEHGQNEQ